MIAKLSTALLCGLLVCPLVASDRPTATVDGKVYPVYDAETEAKPLKRVLPRMPYAAAQAGRGGVATVGAVVNEKGKVRKAYIVKAEAEGEIRAALVNAVKETVFPIMRDPVSQAPITYVVMIDMGLHSAAPQGAVVPPTLGEIISDPKYLREALGRKALVISQLQTGEIAAELLQDLKAAGIAESVQLIPLPKDAVQPKPKSRVAPKYPENLQRRKLGGQARFIYVIGADGTVKGIYCAAADRPELALAAATALVQWRFEPARLQDTPVPIIVTQLLEFY